MRKWERSKSEASPRAIIAATCCLHHITHKPHSHLACNQSTAGKQPTGGKPGSSGQTGFTRARSWIRRLLAAGRQWKCEPARTASYNAKSTHTNQQRIGYRALKRKPRSSLDELALGALAGGRRTSNDHTQPVFARARERATPRPAQQLARERTLWSRSSQH